MASEVLTTAELNELPQELRHYTCQQCGMGHPDSGLFRMVVVFKVGFVAFKTCLTGDETAGRVLAGKERNEEM